MTAAAFTGFGDKALPFLKALGFHQSRDWFRDNRAVYDEHVFEPLAAFVVAMTAACAARGVPMQGTPKGSMFRVYRDVRFAKDKHPFHTHASARLTHSGIKTDQGGFYIHIAPDDCAVYAGFYEPGPPRLAAMRRAILEKADRFFAVEAKLASHALALDPEWSLKRPPREAAGIVDQRLVSALKFKSYIVSRPIEPDLILRPELVDRCVDFVEDALPLLDFGWSALATLEPERS